MKKIKLYVLIPDVSSGDYFNLKLRKKNIDTEYKYYKIRPRVIKNKLTMSKGVADDMNAIFKKFKDKTRSVVIACNTLQLWLNDIKEEYKKNVKIYTTFEACDWKFKKYKHRPIWLGTTPLVERIKNFSTLLTFKELNVQNKVQELIWRIKMINGDDISTAFDFVKNDSNKSKKYQLEKIKKIKKEIIHTLKKINIKRVILGCTELPMIFKEKELGIEFFDPAEILADYAKSQSVLLMFAGGTISSIARKDGALVGGHVFDLIEKLSENMPGSFRHLNITKSDIIYPGLSENLNFKILKKILQAVKEGIAIEPGRIIITHGTDALEQTACYLEKKLRNLFEKHRFKTKILLTAANYPPFYEKSDVWSNLRYAINVDLTKHKKNFVFIAFNKRLVIGSQAIKSYYLGKQMFYLSKKSKEFFSIRKKYFLRVNKIVKKLKLRFNNKFDKRGIITYEINKIRLNHNNFLKKINNGKYQVALFKLYHSGTANITDFHASVSKLITKLVEMNIICFGATENGEPTNLHLYETSVSLLKSGLIPLYNMNYDIALNKLYLLNILENNLKKNDIIDMILRNYVGEINEKLIIKEDINYLKKVYKL
ncbi:MAG: hypothetical protein Fur009_5490 [Candidatus Microgenomates bacterium]